MRGEVVGVMCCVGIAAAIACGSSSGGQPADAGGVASGGDSTSGGAASSGGASEDAANGGASSGGTSSGGGGPGGDVGQSSGASSGGATGTTDASFANLPIGEWTDAPGVCPSGARRVVVTTAADLADAVRGEGTHASDAPSTCYFIKNGVYAQSGVLLYVLRGGDSDAARRYFVGESRSGVVIRGRGNVEDGVNNVTIANLTFDLTGYAGTGAFNTLNLGNGKNITLDHVTFTGDCNTGLMGGHIETNMTENVLVDSCLVEKFGHCGGGGHEDHGIYLAGGKHIDIRNSVISGNSSRGIQMYTQQGAYGTLDQIRVERCRITGNGHADYEDGVVINAAGTGLITNVTFTRDLIYENYYSGIRFVGGAESSVVIDHTTFDSNGAGSASASRSELNVDAAGAASGTSTTGVLFNVGNTLINDCYDGASLGFHVGASFVHGTVPTGAKGNCVAASQTLGDPQFANAAVGDYHPTNPAAAAFGAYAP